MTHNNKPFDTIAMLTLATTVSSIVTITILRMKEHDKLLRSINKKIHKLQSNMDTTNDNIDNLIKSLDDINDNIDDVNKKIDTKNKIGFK